MANWYRCKCPSCFIIKETQTQTITICSIILVKVSIMQREKCIGEVVEIMKHFYTVNGNTSLCSHMVKIVKISLKIKSKGREQWHKP